MHTTTQKSEIFFMMISFLFYLYIVEYFYDKVVSLSGIFNNNSCILPSVVTKRSTYTKTLHEYIIIIEFYIKS